MRVITTDTAPAPLPGQDINPRPECTRCRCEPHPDSKCPKRHCGCRQSRGQQ